MVRDLERAEQRATAIAEREATRRAEVSERTAERYRRGIGRSAAAGLGNVFGGAATLAGGALAIGGGFAIADAVRGQMSAERAAALLSNSATIGGKTPAGATTPEILARASIISKETGTDKGEIIGAVQNYVAKSSDFAGGMANAGFFAKLAKASGTRLEDITGAAGILRAQNKGLSADDMKQMLLDLVEQGKQGAVEINDLAHLAGGLGSTRGLYKGSQTENQRKLLALAQITRTESESAEEAATAVKDLGSEALKKSAGKKAPAWLKAVTKGGTIASPEELIEASLRGTGGNLGELTGIYGQRGVKAFMRLAPLYNAAGGGDKGIAAVRAEMNPDPECARVASPTRPATRGRHESAERKARQGIQRTQGDHRIESRAVDREVRREIRGTRPHPRLADREGDGSRHVFREQPVGRRRRRHRRQHRG